MRGGEEGLARGYQVTSLYSIAWLLGRGFSCDYVDFSSPYSSGRSLTIPPLPPLIPPSPPPCCSEKRQLCYLLARQSRPVNLEEGPCAIADDDLRSTLQEIMSNSRLSEHFLALGRDLDVMEAKSPEDVYKMHLVNTPASGGVDSAKANLASTFVNAFLNAGFGQDKLMTAAAPGGAEGAAGSSSEVHWIFKNKDHGKMSATASLGMVTMWDVDGGLPQLDKYLYSSDPNVVAGALLGVGIVCSNVRSEMDPAYALLYESVNKSSPQVRIGAIMGLGLAYAGTAKAEVQELLAPVVSDPATPIEVAAFAALSLGLVYVSTMNEEATSSLLGALMTRSELELSEPLGRMLCLGLGLLFLGRQEAVEATLEVSKTFNERISRYCQVVLESCAYAGTGNVLKVQELLTLCGEKIEATQEEGWKTAHQSAAAIGEPHVFRWGEDECVIVPWGLSESHWSPSSAPHPHPHSLPSASPSSLIPPPPGLATVAMGEDLGVSMLHRTVEHLLQYAEPPVRRAVPLALALMHVGDPDLQVVDILSRLSHDADTDAAQAALLALGVVGAGTNNARLAGMLRNLSSYYYKDSSMLFLVRVAQGLVHLGKGLLTLSPHHTDRQLLSGVGLAGLLTVLHASLNAKATIGGKHHYLLYYLVPSMYPRMLLTVDEEGKLLQVPVRVGQAVDVVAQAGRPKTITGFQTHSTPVLLSAGERAELGTEKYLAVTQVLEGVVILKKNPEYVE